MLYAQVNNHKNKDMDWPLEWEKCNDMFKYLNRMVWGYQLNLEKKMFATQYGAEYRCVLVKWVDGENKPILGGRKRELLLETSDPAQLEATLFMLISEAEVLARAYKQKGSMIP